MCPEPPLAPQDIDSMDFKLPEFNLDEAQKLWLKTIYSKYKSKEKVDYKTLRATLFKKIQGKFNPYDIDGRLLHGNTELTIFGISYVENNNTVFKNLDITIRKIQEILVNNPDTIQIRAGEIVDSTNLNQDEVSRSFDNLTQMQGFSYGASKDTQNIYIAINVNREEIFNRYIEYDGIDMLLNDYLEKLSPKKVLKSFINIQPVNEYSAHPIFKSNIDQVSQNLCFVLMPFSEEWSARIFEGPIRETVENMGLQCLRADNLSGPIVIEDIWIKINQCAFIIADVTNKNPNVMYELGIVHTIGKPAILITQDMSNIPFDFLHLRHHKYEDDSEKHNEISKKINSLILSIYKEYYPEHSLSVST